MQDPLTLNSGATLQVTIAPFAIGNKLLKTVARELLAVSIDLDTVNLSELSGKDLNVLKNAILQLLQSDAVEATVATCMERCLYNGQRIVRDTFEPIETRPDYLPVAWEVIKANLRPFFAGLDLKSLLGSTPPSNSPDSGSPPTPNP